MAGISPAIFFLIIFLIIIAVAAIKILREYERGVIFRAEGEAQAAEKLAEAANIVNIYPAAIHLRVLQTLTEVAAEKNSTMILPLPIDLLTAFLQKKENE